LKRILAENTTGGDCSGFVQAVQTDLHFRPFHGQGKSVPERTAEDAFTIKDGGLKIPAIEVQVHRINTVSQRPFEDVVSRLTASIGPSDMPEFHRAVASARTLDDLENVVRAAPGASNVMEFARFDMGDVLRKERGGKGPKIFRFVVGNPLIKKEMVKTAPDAASYVPLTILVDERADGVHLTYDSMESFLTPYGNEAALAVARDLDAKVEGMLETAAR
jgi:uncharacterized protein (DUF302 family)